MRPGTQDPQACPEIPDPRHRIRRFGHLLAVGEGEGANKREAEALLNLAAGFGSPLLGARGDSGADGSTAANLWEEGRVKVLRSTAHVCGPPARPPSHSRPSETSGAGLPAGAARPASGNT